MPYPPSSDPNEDDSSVDATPPLNYRGRAFYAVAVAATAAALLFLLWWLRWSVFLVFAAVLVATFLRGGADLLARWLRPLVKLGPGGALASFCALLVLAGTAFGLFAVPELAKQGSALREEVPRAWDNLQRRLDETPGGEWILNRLPVGSGPPEPERAARAPVVSLIPSPEPDDDATTDPTTRPTTGPAAEEDEGLEALIEDPDGVMSRLVTWVGSVIGIAVAFIFLIFTGLYLAAEPGLYRRGILWLLPPRDREVGERALDSVSKALKGWLGAQLFAMTVVGALTGLGLWILGVPLPLVLAVLTALLTFIPNFGPVISAAPPALLAFAAEGRFWNGPSLALSVLVLYFSVQALESYLITPLVQKKAIEMPPALLITAQLLMGVLGGVLGVAVAAPLVAALMAASQELFVVGDPEVEDPMETDGVEEEAWKADEPPTSNAQR